MIIHAIGLVALLISAVVLALVTVIAWIYHREIRDMRDAVRQLDAQMAEHVKKIRHRTPKVRMGQGEVAGP